MDQDQQDYNFVDNLRRNLDRPIPNDAQRARPASTVSLPFGFNESEVISLPPPASLFSYRNPLNMFEPDVLPSVIEPTPAKPSDNNHTYPQSPTWTLKHSQAYITGICYTSPSSTSYNSKFIEKRRMYMLTTPAEATPVWDEAEQAYNFPDIPGMVKMIPGISYAVELDGDTRESLFVAAVQTETSLNKYGSLGVEAVTLLHQLSSHVWGDPENKTPPLYAIEGLERNDRYGAPTPNSGSDARYTGSFSLGATVEKGHAQGKVVPARQPNHTVGINISHQTMLKVGRLYRLLAKLCLPKREYDLIDFHGIDNNLFSLGGLGPSGISVQLNTSFVTNAKNLIDHIGALQGKWHIDGSDDITIPTLFLLFLRLPKGSDPGPFMLGRIGLYCREVGEGMFVICLMFRARDMHSGSSPWIGPGVKHTEEVQKFLDIMQSQYPAAELITRCGLVVYQSTQAVQRSAAFCVNPETRFGNHGTLSTSMTKSLNFSSHGLHLLGTERDANTRLAWEMALNFYNSLKVSGLDSKISFPDIVSSIFYKDSLDTPQHIQSFPIDPADDIQMVQVARFRQYYKHLLQQCRRYLLVMTRSHYFAQMSDLKKEVETISLKISPVEYVPIQSALGSSVSNEDDEGDQEYDIDIPDGSVTIARVVQRGLDRKTGQIHWRIEIEGESEAIWVSHEKGSHWMFTDKNRGAFLRFLNENQEDDPISVERNVNTAITFASPDENSRTLHTRSRLPAVRKRQTKKRKVNDRNLNGGDPEPDSDDKSPEASDDDAAASGEPEDDSEDYEIERIRNHYFEKGEWWFEVVWKGYRDDGTPVVASELQRAAQQMYNRYAADNPEIQTQAPPPDENEDEASGSLSEAGLDLVRRIVSPHTLEDCLQNMESSYDAMSRKEQRAWPRSFHSSSFYRQIAEMKMRCSYYNEILRISPISSAPSLHLNQTIHATLMRVYHAAQGIPMVTTRKLADQVERLALNWEQCRIYLTIYDFVQNVLPHLSELLFDTKTGVFTSHANESESVSPASSDILLAPLAHHIFCYVTARKRDYRQYKKDKLQEDANTALEQDKPGKRKRRTKASGYTKADSVIFSTSNKLLEIPDDIVQGLFPDPALRPKGRLLLSPMDAVDPRNIISESQKCFKQTLQDIFISPFLREVTDLAPRRNQQSYLLERCLVRGAITRQVVLAAGSEAICASPVMADLLDKPHLLFHNTRSRSSSLWTALRRNEQEFLSPLNSYLAKSIPPDGIDREVQHLGDFVRHHFSELQQGRYISEDEFYRNWTPLKVAGARRRANLQMLSRGPVDIDKLLPETSVPLFGVLGLILREALNKDHGWQEAHEGISRCLRGMRPQDSRPVVGFSNCDHWNPLRHKTVSSELIKAKLPGYKMTEKFGLSNLLTFMGTGQGYRTQKFLSLTDATDDAEDTFFCRSLSDSYSLFARAVQLNVEYLGSGGELFEDEIRLMASKDSLDPNFYQVSDQKVWGEPNHFLSARPTVKLPGMSGYSKVSILAKLTPYWTNDIQQKWIEFLQEPRLLDNDPANVTDVLRSFTYTLDFIHSLDLHAFRSGLTPFQTTINLCLLGLCLPPTLDELADFISQNNTLGAYNGLVELGFSPSNWSDIRCALHIIHDHFQSHLCDADAQSLSFADHSGIMIEHVLCKVARYCNRIDFDLMKKWADDAEKEGEWKPTRNGEDSDIFPIPLLGISERILNIVDEYQS
ncbi:hypothetical protein D9757_010568 [Collybiopsis confluens]|uniref:Chromo domain-containing protein n=1 Tax=Collybiopsis confluens TaxID=2823264 RepID=A0A8H5LXK5_9AGAR|nr:hypothetical protein D9757_010568 [Collybiopsis confluens]